MIKTIIFNPFQLEPVKVGDVVPLAKIPPHSKILAVRTVGLTTEFDVEIPDDGEDIRLA